MCGGGPHAPLSGRRIFQAGGSPVAAHAQRQGRERRTGMAVHGAMPWYVLETMYRTSGSEHDVPAV